MDVKSYISGSGSGSSSAVGGGVIIGYDIGSYSFSASDGTVTFSGLGTVNLLQILKITNITNGIAIYDPTDPNKLGSLSSNTLILDYDTSSMNDSDTLQILFQYNNSEDYSTSSKLTSVLNPDYGHNIDRQPVLTAAQDLTATMTAVGSEVDVSTYKNAKFFVNVDINNSLDVRFQVVAHDVYGSSEDYPLSDAAVTVHTDSTYVAAAASRYFELNDDVDQFVVIEVDCANSIASLQLKAAAGTVGATAGQIDSVYVIVGY